MTVTNTAAPILSGTAKQGQTLVTSNGTWTYDLDYLTYAYRWLRCDANGQNCVAIDGETTSRLFLRAADVGYRIRSEVTATEHAGTVPADPGDWQGPVTINSGGTYVGSWESTDSTPAVTIATTDPVVLSGRVRNLVGPGTGYIIDAYHSLPGGDIDVTIENMQVFGGTTYQTSPRWFVAQNFANLVIRNCTIENTRGIELWPTSTVGATVLITKNRHHNIVGGASEAGLSYVGNFVQFRVIRGADIEVSWNEIENEYNKSEPEDIISIYHTENVHVVDNMFWHQSNPNNAPGSSQSGITLDSSDAGNAINNCVIERNQVVDGMGIFFSLQGGGSGNQMTDNTVVQDGFLANGSRIANGYSGIAVIGGASSTVTGNTCGYVNKSGARVDYDIRTSNGTFTPNTSIAGTVTRQMELDEWTSWKAKLAANNITVGVPTGPVTPPPGTPYTLYENWDAIDPTVWRKKWWFNGDAYYNQDFSQEVGMWKDANAFSSSGVLTLRAKREDAVDFTGTSHQFTSGIVQSNGIQGIAAPGALFTYGFFEARIKAAPGTGMWTAFWLCDGNWPSVCPREIDIVEIVGPDPARAHFNFHANDVGGGGGSSYLHNENLDVNYHVYGCEWRPTYIAWSFDGVEKFRYTGASIPSNPHYIILNLQVGGAASWAGTPNPGTFTQSDMLVDWVRVSP